LLNIKKVHSQLQNPIHKINKSIISGAFSFASKFQKCKIYMQKYTKISLNFLISKALYIFFQIEASPSE
jgi:hypothetical protein